MIFRTKRRMTLCLCLLSALLVFIWGNSLLPASVSGALSQWVRDLLGFTSQGSAEAGEGLLRKIAHFSEFSLLGATLGWLYAMLLKKQYAVAAVSLLLGAATACVDETLQGFSPGRNPSLIDVGIDTAGVAVGIGLLLTGYILFSKKKSFGGTFL